MLHHHLNGSSSGTDYNILIQLNKMCSQFQIRMRLTFLHHRSILQHHKILCHVFFPLGEKGRMTQKTDNLIVLLLFVCYRVSN